MSTEQQTGRKTLDPNWVAAVNKGLHETLTPEQDRAVRAANAATQGQKPADPEVK